MRVFIDFFLTLHIIYSVVELSPCTISSITNIHVHVPQLGFPGNSPEQIKDTQVPRLKVFMKTIEIGFQVGANGSKRNESFASQKALQRYAPIQWKWPPLAARSNVPWALVPQRGS